MSYLYSHRDCDLDELEEDVEIKKSGQIAQTMPKIDMPAKPQPDPSMQRLAVEERTRAHSNEMRPENSFAIRQQPGNGHQPSKTVTFEDQGSPARTYISKLELSQEQASYEAPPSVYPRSPSAEQVKATEWNYSKLQMRPP